MAVHGPHGLVGVRNPLAQRPDERAELPRHRVADGVRDVDRSWRPPRSPPRACGTGNRGRSGPRLRARTRRCRCIRAPSATALHRLLEHLLGRHAQLLLHVDRRVAMNVWMRSDLRAVAARRRRGGCRSRWRARGRTRCCPGSAAAMACTASKSPLRRRGKARLDHVDAHALELARDAQSSLPCVIDAPGLCSPSRKRRVEDDQVVGHRMSPVGHAAAAPAGTPKRDRALCNAAIHRGDTAFSVAVTMFGSRPTP